MSNNYRHLRHHVVFAVIGPAFLFACGGGDGGPNGPSEVLTSVDVTPSSVAIFHSAPGNTAALVVTPRNQNGGTMAGVGAPSFESSNPAVATVNTTGIVTAVAAGTVQITATVTDGGVTLTKAASVTVKVAPLLAVVTAPQFDFLPDTVHISAGGDVSWSVGDIHHTVHFITSGAPADVPEMLNSGASRSFPTSGSFSYVCTFHATMSGIVHVH